MATSPSSRRFGRPLGFIAALAVLVGIVGIIFVSTESSSAAESQAGPKPTVVLVHGAFADASGWNDVIERLQTQGYTVIAPANPLRSLSGDAAYLRSILETVTGPIILVGHSYGGAVMTNAATGNANVKALIYVAGFAPAPGENIFELATKFPGSLLPEAINPRPFPLPDGSIGIDTYIQIDMFRSVFAADLPERVTAAMAATQRPASLASGQEPSISAAWKTIPSWFLIPQQDNTIPPEVQRFMAQRAGGAVTEISGPHVVMMTRPSLVVDLIQAATNATD